MTLVNAHAIQQLTNYHEKILKAASHDYLLAEQNEDVLVCYKEEIKILEDKVNRLEVAA